MSKKRRKNQYKQPVVTGLEIQTSPNRQPDDSTNAAVKSFVFGNWLRYLKSNALMTVIVCFLALGALGSGLKYLDDDAKRVIAKRAGNKGALNNREESFLNKINPFLPAALPSPTPQLSKEYVYAGSRLLAVEDANATAAPPADLAVWRPSSGFWWVMGGNGSQQFSQAWGQTGDVPAPDDYDGDGKTDLCIFRPSSGAWWILKSSDGNYYSVSFGTSGDKTAQADFDGDGKTDIAVFRPSNGTWYILQSTDNQTQAANFGLSTDVPAPTDYNGDGLADIAVWRNSDMKFYLRTGASTYETVHFGVGSTEPVAGDYDGDGRADFAIRETNTANWIIRNSSNGQIQTISWQQSTDLAVQNDYDGDGKVDIAVWRDSTGNWYIRKSGSNGALRQEQWGASGDIPVPAHYRR